MRPLLAEIRTQALGADHLDVSSTQYKMALVLEEKHDFLRGEGNRYHV